MSIIIISDHRDELDNLIALAADAGLGATRGFNHPAAALDWCESHVPDLVLVDFLMRASNGIEVIRHLRAMPAMAQVPLLLMLPHGFETVSAEAFRQGATDFLAKPVDPTEFTARVINLLALQSARAELQVPAGRWQRMPAQGSRHAGLH